MSDELMRWLASAFDRADPVPATVLAAARSAGQLAGRRWSQLALVADDQSRCAGENLRGTRTGVLGFADHRARIDIELERDCSTVRLTGLLTTQQPIATLAIDTLAIDRVAIDTLAIRRLGTTGLTERPIAVDQYGRFAVSGLPTGPLGIVLRRTGEPEAVTPWFVA